MGRQGARLAQFVALLLVLVLIVHGGTARSWPIPVCPVQYPPQTPDTPPSPIPAAPDGTTPFTPPTPFVPQAPFAPQGPFAAPGPIGLPTPIVRLRVRAPLDVPPEKEIEYRLIVENVSQAEAHHVAIRDRLPRGITMVRAKPEPSKQLSPKDGVTDLLWEIGTMKGGERKEIIVALQPGATDEISNSAYVQYEHGQTIKTRIRKPSLDLRIVVPPRAVLPDPIALRLQVTNTGSMLAQDVILKDELPDGLVYGSSKPELKGSEKPLIWKLGTLRPGEMRQVQLQLIPTQAGTFANKVEVTAAGGVSRKRSADIVVEEAKAKISQTEPQRRPADRVSR